MSNEATEGKLKATIDLWSQKASPEDLLRRKNLSWMNHPRVEKNYINKRISGFESKNWLEHFKLKYAAQPFTKVASLGCGAGGLERHAHYLGISQKIDAFDIADGAIKIAKQEAHNMGMAQSIHYECCDISTIRLSPQTYDAVFTSQSAHHFESLEHIFDQVKQSLKPGGLFVLNEFIGPTRFQWTDQQLEIANAILDTLPAAYKTSVANREIQKDKITRPTIEQMISYDPSEAVRSAEIMKILTDRFEIIEKIDFGGTLLQILLEDIAGNFNAESDYDNLLIDMICTIEDILIKNQTIKSDFVFIVCRA